MSSLDIVWLRSSAIALLMGFELEYNIKIRCKTVVNFLASIHLSLCQVLISSNSPIKIDYIIHTTVIYISHWKCACFCRNPRFPMQPWSQLFPFASSFQLWPQTDHILQLLWWEVLQAFAGIQVCSIPWSMWAMSVLKKIHTLCGSNPKWKRIRKQTIIGYYYY